MLKGISPTEPAALEIISMGLNTFTIILDIWVLVCSSIIPFLAMNHPAPIMISSESIWKNTVSMAM